MRKQPVAASTGQIGAPAGERLDSWKEISAYLKRDPRTLQRWEKKEGLPVHRHVHESQTSVYAFTSELDAWLASRTISTGNGFEAESQTYLGGRLWVLAAILVLASSAVIFGVMRQRSRPEPPTTRAFRQVWAGDEVDYWNAVSPDGRYASFTNLQTGDLGVRDLVLGQNRRVTNKGKTTQESPAWALNAAFSPDGKSIAYWWWNDDRSNEIRIIGLDGKGQRTLLKDPEKTSYDLMDWSADGKSIAAVIERTGESDLALISPTDGSVRILKQFRSGQPRRVAFSRDSRYLAYDAPVGPDHAGDIFLISVDGKEDRPVIEYLTDEFLVGWGPRGDQLVFGSDRTGSNGIWRVGIKQGKVEGEAELLKGDVGRVLPLTVTRSGSVFSLLDVGLADVFVTELGSANPPSRISEHFIGTRTYPSFSADGLRLLYQSQRRPGDAALIARDLESGTERTVHPKLESFMKPRWADQGRAYDVQGSDGKTFGTWRIDPHSGDASLRASGPLKRVYAPPEGLPGPGDQITAPDGSATLAAVRNSPPGFNSLRIITRGGATVRELVRLKQPERFTAAFAWSRDSRWVFFAKNNGSETELFRIPAAGGPVESTGLRRPMILFVSVHPDGKRLAYQGGEPNLELWALDGFLAR
jgi:Tol biopolymer transport system component